MTPALARRLTTTDAVVVGLGAMIGAGIFSAFGPASRAAGPSLLVAFAVAAFVAYCNATSSAQLAAVYPTSGGTYIYGRERLGHWWGFTAGWGFVVGKTASCAAMALTFAAYVVPDPGWVQRSCGAAAVLVLVGLNYLGVSKTALVAKVLVSVSVVCLLVLVIAVWAARPRVTVTHGQQFWAGGVYGLLQAAGLLFFAFAGYARIATMGEEVRDPAHTIPRAIQIALLGAMLLYAVVGFTALVGVGPQALASAPAPLAAVSRTSDVAAIGTVVRIGGAVASLGALLALIAGIGRTTLAMSRHQDLPRWLGAVHPKFKVPHHAEVALGLVVCILVATVDLRNAIGFSSFGVLVYYLIANLAAYTQPAADRRWPRALQILGAGACVLLVATLPVSAILGGIALFAVGIAGRAVRRVRPGQPRDPRSGGGWLSTRTTP